MDQLSLKDWLIRLFFLFLCGFMINRLFFFSPGMVEITSSYILYPALKLQKYMIDPIRHYYQYQADNSHLQESLYRLKNENLDLQARLIALESTIDFQRRSKAAREYEKRYDFSEKILVHILMKSFDQTGHYLWIDGGLQQKIEVNMIAVYKNNIVGRVIHVDQLYSKIALITDKRCKISVECLKTKSLGIYEGNNSFDGSLEFVPHYKTLLLEDTLISTGQGLVYPSGFVVGRIKSFYLDDATYKVVIQPSVDIQNLEFMYLIKV